MAEQESRKEPRQLKQEAVFVEVLSTSVNDDGGLVVKCTTHDVSRNGIKVTSNYPISTGVILELLVDFEQDALKFLLTGEVKWCRQIDNEPTYQCGFELIPAEHSDIITWQELFEEELPVG